MADQDPRPPARGDEAELFEAYSHELIRAVSSAVRRTTPQVIEDACAFAWAQLMERQPDRDRSWKGWMFRTAEREAWRLTREIGIPIPIRDVEYEPGAWIPIDPRDHYAIRDGVEDAFSVLGHLSPRLQQIKLLRALGLHHAEISEITGDSPTRVAQLIAQANMRIYEHLEDRAFETEDLSPRAKRLWELERDQPRWLTSRIGRAPQSTRRGTSQNEKRRAWRAALALDDYRAAVGGRRFDEAAEVSPADPDNARLYELARKAVDNLTYVRGRLIGRGLGD
jgi:DNA-directed RNA polymerase specialized sigma24 family protein